MLTVLKNAKCHPVHDLLLIPKSIPQYCWSLSLGDSYTVFQECRLKSDMPGPSKHNRGQKPQRITHNQSPKEFPWTQLLTRKLCIGGEDRRAAETSDLNSMDSTASDCLRQTLSTLVCAASGHKLEITYIYNVLTLKEILKILYCIILFFSITLIQMYILYTQSVHRMSRCGKSKAAKTCCLILNIFCN